MPPALLTDERLRLPSVTLVAVTSVAVAATARAMAECLRHVAFGDVAWCSSVPPPPGVAGTARWCPIDPITSRGAYSAFVLGQLAGHVTTEHVLLIQWDGYVLDPLAWDDAFLNCDYIGAPWPHFRDGLDVGNGGFSLRSRRLLEATARLPQTGEAEDVAICRTWRRRLELDHGLVFAPIELARRFSYERAVPAQPTFGFHGVFNLPDHLAAAQFRALLRSIELTIMAPNEIDELLRRAVRHFDPGLALMMIRRRIAQWHAARLAGRSTEL